MPCHRPHPPPRGCSLRPHSALYAEGSGGPWAEAFPATAGSKSLCLGLPILPAQFEVAARGGNVSKLIGNRGLHLGEAVRVGVEQRLHSQGVLLGLWLLLRWKGRTGGDDLGGDRRKPKQEHWDPEEVFEVS